MAKRKSQKRSQKMYKMKGCSKKTCKKYLGGKVNVSNAYPSPGAKFGGFNFLNPTSQLQRGGNSTALIGNSWSPSPSNWPGVNGGSANHLSLNPYKEGTDVQLGMKASGANPPFSGRVGGGGNRKRRTLKNTKKNKKQKGGSSNFLMQDFINLGRNIQYGMGSTYNSLNGYKHPVNPMPFKGQLQNHKLY